MLAPTLAFAPARGEEPVAPPASPPVEEVSPASPGSQTAPALPDSAAPQTAPAPRTRPYGGPSFVFAVGLGPGGGGNEQFEAKTPTLLFQVGGSIPIAPKAWTDIVLGFSIASYREESPETTWTGDALLRVAYVTASVRTGRPGKHLGVFGSAGAGLAYVALGEPGGFGVYPEPVGSRTAPVLTGALSLEHPGRRSRFLVELRYSDISADLGSDAGGTLDAGGPILLLGWRSGL